MILKNVFSVTLVLELASVRLRSLEKSFAKLVVVPSDIKGASSE